MTYYANDSRTIVYRASGGTCEVYNFTVGRWTPSLDLWDMLIGELWVDEISEGEANAIIAKRNSEIHSGGGAPGTAR